MRHLIRGTALLLLLLGVVVLPASFAQDKAATDKKDDAKKDDAKKDDAKKDDAKKDDLKKLEEPKKEHLHKLGSVQGKIVTVEEGKKVLKISVEVQVPNPAGQSEYLQAQAAWNTVNRRDANAVTNALNRVAKAQAGLTKMEKKDVEYTALEDVKVRTLAPAATFDEKGNLKKYTAKELAELKGPDKTVPGFPAEFSDLHAGMTVQVNLVSKKDPLKAPRTLKPEDPAAEDYKPMMALIIAAETPMAPK